MSEVTDYLGEGGAPCAALAALAPLPCLNSNNSNETPLPAGVVEGLQRLTTNHRKTAYKLAKSVARLCGKYGVERVGFLTLTFADHVTCAKEAGRRYNSLRTGVLAERYVETICVLERMKSGRIHFHLLVVLPVDIRTGFDFGAASRGDYRSANSQLRAEWAFWRSTARGYGFGRTELLPVKSNEEGLSKYVGKYIAKHVGQREERDRGVRLVRYSRGASIGSNAFMFASVRSKLWRWQVSEFARRNGCVDLAALRQKFGPRWAYYQRASIVGIEPPSGRISEVWIQDRVAIAKRVADSVGCELAQAFAGLFSVSGSRALEFEVPRWSGVPVPRREDRSDATLGDDVTVVWWSEDRNSVRIDRRTRGGRIIGAPASSGCGGADLVTAARKVPAACEDAGSFVAPLAP